MLVELKNGETLNGHLVTCDTWMNLTLKEVVQTSPVRPTFLYLLGLPKPFLWRYHGGQTRQDSSDSKLIVPYRKVINFGDYRRSMLRATMCVVSVLFMEWVGSNSLSRLNTYEYRTRSSTWSRINNKVNRVTTEAEADKEATTVGEETEAVEVEAAGGAVVEGEDHDTGRDKHTPERR
jgi:small nuclear ribonucleoprotein (snRNP)-like protein